MAGTSMQRHNLAKMVNQIAENLGSGMEDMQYAEAVANHLRRFWPRAMREQVIVYLQRDGSGLRPLAQQAIRRLGDF